MASYERAGSARLKTCLVKEAFMPQLSWIRAARGLRLKCKLMDASSWVGQV